MFGVRGDGGLFNVIPVTHDCFFWVADTMSLISSPLEAAMANYNYAALNISFDLLKDGASKFPAFLDMLEQKFWSPDTPLQGRLDLLRRTVCNYTWQKLRNIADLLENAWIGDAAIADNNGGPQMRPLAIQSPLLRRPIRVNRNLADEFQPQSRWSEVRSAFITRLIRDSDIDTRQTLTEFPPLMDISMRDLHNCNFNNALSVHNSVGSPLDPAEAVRFYLKTIPESVVFRMHAMPQTVRAAQAEVDRLSRLQGAFERIKSKPKATPLAAFSSEPYATLSGTGDARSRGFLNELREAEASGNLPEVAVKLAGFSPDTSTISRITMGEYARFGGEVRRVTDKNLPVTALVASITNILPRQWVRTSKRITETEGKWDFSDIKTQEDIDQAQEMMDKIRSLKRKRVRDLEEHSDDDEDDRYEKKDKPVDKQPRNAKGQVVRNSKPNTRSVVSSSDMSAASVMAALNAVSQTQSDLLAVMRSSGSGVSCHKCGGDHLVRRCPDLLDKDGNFAEFCNYCQGVGHSLGQPDNTTCPVLRRTVCPTCTRQGHTLDFCPQNTCAKCHAKGHTSKVCRQRKPGVYAYTSELPTNTTHFMGAPSL